MSTTRVLEALVTIKEDVSEQLTKVQKAAMTAADRLDALEDETEELSRDMGELQREVGETTATLGALAGGATGAAVANETLGESYDDVGDSISGARGEMSDLFRMFDKGGMTAAGDNMIQDPESLKFKDGDLTNRLEMMRKVAKLKNEIGEENKFLRSTADDTDKSVLGEATAFAEAAQKAGTLSEMKEAARKSNSTLAAAAGTTEAAVQGEADELISLAYDAKTASDYVDKLGESQLKASAASEILRDEIGEGDAVHRLKKTFEILGRTDVSSQLDEAAESNRKLGEAADSTEGSMAGELQGFAEAAAEATNLADLKDKASSANRSLAKAAGTTEAAVQGEKSQLLSLAHEAENSGEFLDLLSESNLKAASTSEVVRDNVHESAGSFEALQETFRTLSGKNIAAQLDDVSEASRLASDELDMSASSIGKLAYSADSAEGFLDMLAEKQAITSREANKAKRSLKGVEGATISQSLAAIPSIKSNKKLSKALGAVGDEADDLKDHLDGLPDAFATSLNVGPFNFALRNLLTTLPVLITTVGSLVTALVGLASAAITAGVALGGMFAGGMLLMAESIKQSDEEVENLSEGVQELTKEIRAMLVDAMEPLMNDTSVEMFKRAIEGVATAVNMMAQSMASVQGVISQFQSNIGSSFFNYLPAVMATIEARTVQFLPILETLFDWFMRKLPSAINFFARETEQFLPALSTFTLVLVNFFRAFTEFGITIFEGMLPVIASMLHALSGFIDIFNALPKSVLSTIGAFVAGAFVLAKFLDVASGVKSYFGGIIKAFKQGDTTLEKLINTLKALHGPFRKFGELIENGKEQMTALGDEVDDGAEGFKKLGLMADEAGKQVREALNPDGKDTNAKKRFKSLMGSELFGSSTSGADEEGGDDTVEDATRLASVLGMIYQFRDKIGKLVAGLRVATSASTVLSGALATLIGVLTSPAWIAALLVGLAAGVVLFENLDGIVSALNNSLRVMGDVTGGVIASGWNVLVDVAELLLSPIFAIADGIMLIMDALGATDAVVGFGEALLSAFVGGGQFAIDMMDNLGDSLDIIGDIIYFAVIWPFRMFAQMVKLSIGWAQFLVDTLMGISVVEGSFDFIAGLLRGLGNLVDWVAEKFNSLNNGFINNLESFVNRTIVAINNLIRAYNEIAPKPMHYDTIEPDFKVGGNGGASMRLEGLKKAGDSKKRDGSDASSSVAGGNQYTTNNYNTTEYNFGDFNMEAQDKSWVQRVVKDALKEAERNRRLQTGGV